MCKQAKTTSLLLIGLLLLAGLVSIAVTSGRVSAAPIAQMDMSTATPTPAAAATEIPASAPAVISGTDQQAQPQTLPTAMSGMVCPMMGNMGSMSGMQGMGAMTGMQGMNGMTGMNGMQNMQGMGGMSGMGMGSMQGMTSMSPMAVQDEIEAGAFWRINPWWLIGWLVLFLLVIGVLAAVITWLVWFITRYRKPQPVKVSSES